MLRHIVLMCSVLLMPLPLSRTSAQGQPIKAGVPVEVVAIAFEYVPTTVSHPGHSYTNCQGNTDYFGQFQSYGDSGSGSVSGTATTNTNCSSTFSAPTEGTTYRRVNYTIARGDHALYLLSCTQTTKMTAAGAPDSLMGGIVGALARSKCPAFAIGSKYTLTLRNTSDARLVDTNGGKPSKLEYLSSVGLPVTTTQSAPLPQAQAGTAPQQAKVHMTSSPSGGEIFIDGNFFGNASSDITLPVGEHVVKVTIGGKDWSRTIQITSGEISLHAEIPAGK